MWARDELVKLRDFHRMTFIIISRSISGVGYMETLDSNTHSLFLFTEARANALALFRKKY